MIRARRDTQGRWTHRYGNEFDRIVLAFGTWASLSGKNPGQDVVFALASGSRLTATVPYFQADRFTAETIDFTIDDLTNPS